LADKSSRPESLLIELDRQFAKLATDTSIGKAFDQYLDDDALQLPEGGSAVRGRSAIVQGLMSLDEKAKLLWQPKEARMAKSEDLGYTWGLYQLILSGDPGKLQVHHGKYVSIWRKNAAGNWKLILDMGNGNPEPKP
jgi:ketosteroid isomerase-like protein